MIVSFYRPGGAWHRSKAKETFRGLRMMIIIIIIIIIQASDAFIVSNTRAAFHSMTLDFYCFKLFNIKALSCLPRFFLHEFNNHEKRLFRFLKAEVNQHLFVFFVSSQL